MPKLNLYFTQNLVETTYMVPVLPLLVTLSYATKYQIFFKKILFLALLDLLCCMWASSSFGEENCLVAVHGLLIAVASLVVGFPGGSDGKESA